ncbi:HAAS signaling domain-containing protein [Aeromicrobium sp. CF4.19]|uniref:HAAS signaling domain-containing protein n=1 Tax=Aeromicrobium sp. CF4.19 TaxID=3373082 RepID=UPI003EE442EE
MTVDDTLLTYRQNLVLALRLKDVPGDRIGEIVAEVESHVTETGEDPVEAFGTPKQYAASLTDEHRPGPWWQTLISLVSSAVAGWFLAQGALALLLGEQHWGQSGWVWVVAGIVVGIPGGLSVWRRSSRVRDPRGGSDLVPSSVSGLALLIGAPIALVLVAFAAIRLLG